jgi:hypothetical protein
MKVSSVSWIFLSLSDIHSLITISVSFIERWYGHASKRNPIHQTVTPSQLSVSSTPRETVSSTTSTQSPCLSIKDSPSHPVDPFSWSAFLQSQAKTKIKREKEIERNRERRRLSQRDTTGHSVHYSSYDSMIQSVQERDRQRAIERQREKERERQKEIEKSYPSLYGLERERERETTLVNGETVLYEEVLPVHQQLHSHMHRHAFLNTPPHTDSNQLSDLDISVDSGERVKRVRPAPVSHSLSLPVYTHVNTETQQRVNHTAYLEETQSMAHPPISMHTYRPVPPHTYTHTTQSQHTVPYPTHIQPYAHIQQQTMVQAPVQAGGQSVPLLHTYSHSVMHTQHYPHTYLSPLAAHIHPSYNTNTHSYPYDHIQEMRR